MPETRNVDNHTEIGRIGIQADLHWFYGVIMSMTYLLMRLRLNYVSTKGVYGCKKAP